MTARRNPWDSGDSSRPIQTLTSSCVSGAERIDGLNSGFHGAAFPFGQVVSRFCKLAREQLEVAGRLSQVAAVSQGSPSRRRRRASSTGGSSALVGSTDGG